MRFLGLKNQFFGTELSYVMSQQFEEFDEYGEISLKTLPIIADIGENGLSWPLTATGSRFRELVAGFGHVFDFLIPAW